ncbi:MAG: alpha/beta hydrolase [Chitinivibrionales bacterium]|nr:alpha/beta hydrolase [Chitinivibrionales bacterium]
MARVTRTSRENLLQLPDKRQLGYAIYGDPQGYPIIYCHGIPGSRLECNPDETIPKRLGIRLIIADRPGIGLSSPKPGRTILEWPDDVECLCQSLALRTCGLIATSGGSPYALAAAFKYPQRYKHIAIVSAIAPLFEKAVFSRLDVKMRLLFNNVKRHPRISSTAFGVSARLFDSRIDRIFSFLVAHMPEYDKVILRQPQMRDMFRESIAEVFHQGGSGLVEDMQLQMQPWGFELNQINKRVHIWHGTNDTVAPIRLAEWFRENLPNSVTHYFKQSGHFFILNKTAEILASVKEE